MNANMVRFGGIAAFVYLALLIIGSFAVAGNPTLVKVLSAITTALMLFVLWTTKGYLNARGYAKADIFIYIIMAFLVLMFILGLIGMGATPTTRTGGAAGAASNTGSIIGLIVFLIVVVAGIMLSIRFIDFGKIGGGIWKAVGILYLIGMIAFLLMIVLFILVFVAKSIGLLAAAGGVGLVAGLVFLAALIVHGIALIMGAGKMGAAS